MIPVCNRNEKFVLLCRVSVLGPVTCVLEESSFSVLDCLKEVMLFRIPLTNGFHYLWLSSQTVLWHKRTNVSRSCQFYIGPEDRWHSLLVLSCTAPHLGHRTYGPEPKGEGAAGRVLGSHRTQNHYVPLLPQISSTKKEIRGMRGRHTLQFCHLLFGKKSSLKSCRCMWRMQKDERWRWAVSRKSSTASSKTFRQRTFPKRINSQPAICQSQLK